jgi:ABC-type transport system involved in multi-copper enzyme maturation permease subunit
VKNPIAQRELIGTLRTRKALGLQAGVAVVFALLVVARWPTDAQVELSCAQSQEVFRLFGYGLLATLILLVPVFPAATLVREKNQGTLALLLNSPMRPWEIYLGKLTACSVSRFSCS